MFTAVLHTAGWSEEKKRTENGGVGSVGILVDDFPHNPSDNKRAFRVRRNKSKFTNERKIKFSHSMSYGI